MRLHQGISPGVRRGIVLAVGLACSGALIASVDAGGSPPAAVDAKPRLEASIFSYDGQDFVRTQTTLLTKEGKSAVNTKLEHDTPAYKALAAKHSYTGDANVFGHEYHANYAPLTSEDGKLTGALFVATAK